MCEQSAQRAAVSMGRSRTETVGTITLRISHKLRVQLGRASLCRGAAGIHFRLLPDLSRSALNSLPAFHSGHFPEFASERPTS